MDIKQKLIKLKNKLLGTKQEQSTSRKTIVIKKEDFTEEEKKC